MEALFGKASRQLRSLQDEFDQLDKTCPGKGSSIEGHISAGIATVALTFRNIEEFIVREPDMDRRRVAKQRLKEMRSTHQSLKDSYEEYKRRGKQAERRQLLGSRHEQVARHSTAISEEIVAEREERTLQNAEGSLSGILVMGMGALDNLRSQRHALKSAQRRIFDVGTSLGISQSLMRGIARRTRQDGFIFSLCLIFTVLVLYICWRFL